MLKDEHFKEFMAQIDKDKDGQIDFEEFHNAFSDTFKVSHGGKDYRKHSGENKLKGF